MKKTGLVFLLTLIAACGNLDPLPSKVGATNTASSDSVYFYANGGVKLGRAISANLVFPENGGTAVINSINGTYVGWLDRSGQGSSTCYYANTNCSGDCLIPEELILTNAIVGTDNDHFYLVKHDDPKTFFSTGIDSQKDFDGNCTFTSALPASSYYSATRAYTWPTNFPLTGIYIAN